MVEPVPGRRPEPVPFQQEARRVERPRPEPRQEVLPPEREPRAELARAEAVRREAEAAGDPNRAQNAPPPPPPRLGGADDVGLFVDLFA